MNKLINLLDNVAEQFDRTVTKNDVTVRVTFTLNHLNQTRLLYKIEYFGRSYEITTTATGEAVDTNLTDEMVDTLILRLS